jgi:cell division inhibitor SulA
MKKSNSSDNLVTGAESDLVPRGHTMKNLFDDAKLPLAEEFYKKATFFSQKDEIDTLESSIDSAPLGNYHEIVGDFENKVSAYFL